MTPAPILSVEGVWKRYFRGAAPPARRSPLAGLFTPLRRARAVLGGRLADASDEAFWALREVSFSVRPGEVVGVLGENGAGKTTLLRLISAITRPTRGQIRLRGRVGSLLEAGIGFHPNLTGEENIFLYGAMLGLRRPDVARHLDEIVSFAEVAPMLYTPMRFYSAGMYARLAFAVAAVLAPDILLVDEVLSVSDPGFQRRSVEVIARRARAGGAVLFVSHSLQTVESLCSRCLWLSGGRLEADGPSAHLLPRYRASLGAVTEPH